MNHLYLVIEIIVAFGLLLAAKKFFGKAGIMAWIAIATIFANIFEAKNIDLFGLNLAAGHVMFGSVFLAHHRSKRGHVLYFKLVRCSSVRKNQGIDRREIPVVKKQRGDHPVQLPRKFPVLYTGFLSVLQHGPDHQHGPCYLLAGVHHWCMRYTLPLSCQAVIVWGRSGGCGVKYEIIGIIGTLLILVGFLSNSEKKIRLFDMAGSVLFVVYGALVGAYSNILLNGILVFVHIFKLRKMRAKG